MVRVKTLSGPAGMRGEPLRDRVIEAAETLLRDGKADFSMRELAAEAGVSFATPFNQFGSKAAIMHALSARRIETMTQRFVAAPLAPSAADRVMRATGVAAEVMLAEPQVNRAVMAWIGTASSPPGQALTKSTSLWTLALGACEGLAEARREEALARLPRQLAFGFRGVLSFWTAGEIPDELLALQAREIANTVLLGFTERSQS